MILAKRRWLAGIGSRGMRRNDGACSRKVPARVVGVADRANRRRARHGSKTPVTG
jgi:hypothetical protein